MSRAQEILEVRVVDAQNRIPLLGVHVRSSLTGRGDATDIDGRFRIELPDSAEQVEFSYTG